MAKFIAEPDLKCCESDAYFVLDTPLIYESDLLGVERVGDDICRVRVTVPVGFITDLASIPLGIKWAHREAILHDYLYRIDSDPIVTRHQADQVIYEAMQVKGKSWFTRWWIFSGVVLGGWLSYHKKKVDWKP